MDSAQAIKEIKRKTDIALVADIHFNYRFAIEAIKNGIDKIRLNPGNIYQPAQVREVVQWAKKYKIPIRVGINSGSVRGNHIHMANAMIRAARSYIKLIEDFGFSDIVVSVKASCVLESIDAYRKLAKVCNYPFHLGITATGLMQAGIVKSSLGIGVLLLEGIGDTIRVSLTGSPEEEVYTAKQILQSLGLRNFGPEIISCPTCGRCEVDLVAIVDEVKKRLNGFRITSRDSSIRKIALMGCFVNGPGEAKEADIGVAFGRSFGLLFKEGKPIGKFPIKKCIEFLKREISGKK
jgi:(E)-4-hydroxy-3-methylbut-2-enyl-diphosphate synthase